MKRQKLTAVIFYKVTFTTNVMILMCESTNVFFLNSVTI